MLCSNDTNIVTPTGFNDCDTKVTQRAPHVMFLLNVTACNRFTFRVDGFVVIVVLQDNNSLFWLLRTSSLGLQELSLPGTGISITRSDILGQLVYTALVGFCVKMVTCHFKPLTV